MKAQHFIKIGISIILSTVAILLTIILGGAVEYQSVVFAAPNACVSGPHNGHITADEAWCLADSPHLLSADVIVDTGVTLTVEPGVTVMGGNDQSLKVQGNLDAPGTASQPITFTAISGGVSGWEGLIFDGSQGAGTGNLRYVTVMHSGDPIAPDLSGLEGYWGGDIYVRDVLNGEVRLENTRIISVTGFGAWGTVSSDYGVYVDNSRVTISDTLFSAIGDGQNSSGIDQDYPLHISGASSVVTLTNNVFSGNYQDRVRLISEAMMNHDVTLSVQNGLDGYVLDDDFTVPSTVTLSVEPGVTVMGFNNSAELRVEGHLDAIGTPTQPITFTSTADSGPSQWAGIIFVGGTGDIQHATIRYGGRNTSLADGYHQGSNIAVYNVITGEVRLSHVTIESEYHFDGWHHFKDHGIYINNSHVLLANSIIRNNCDGLSEDSGIFVTGANSIITLTNNLLQNNWVGLDLDADSRAILTNNAFVDHSVSSLRVKNARADLWQTTFARGATQATGSYQPAGIFLSDDGTAVLSNTILSRLGIAVRVDGTSAVTLTNTLWDNNDIDVVGTITETGHFDGLTAFDTDGYHITRYSAAINRGVDAGILDDIDGDNRPLPVGTQPDLGADEIAEALDELIPEMEAYPLRWVTAVDPSSGAPYSRFEQQYLIALYYGSADANPPAVDVSINDTLPAGLAYEGDKHNPPMTFNQNGQSLTWQTQSPILKGDTVQVLLASAADTLSPGDILTNTAIVNAGASQFNLSHAFEVPLFPPLITTPGNGEICTSAELSGTQVVGVAQANAIVYLYENGTEILTATSPISGIFTMVYSSTHVGINSQTTLTATTCNPANPTECSESSNAVTVKPVQSFWCPQASSWTVPPDEPYAGQYEFKNPNTGEFATQNWVIVGPHHFPASSISLRLPDRGAQPPAPYITVDGNRIDPVDPPTKSPWQYNFPVPMRPYDILFYNNLDPLEHSDGGRLIDPDGYIFDVTQGFDPISPTIHAVQGVTVTCMVSMTEWGGWIPWPAHLYNDQQNPQVTGDDGYFAFFTPPGDYYLQVDGINGYQSWRSPMVTVISDIVHVNVPYTPLSNDTPADVLLTVDGPQPSVITVAAGSTVKWMANVDGTQPPSMRMAQFENPSLRPLSDIDPIASTNGFDGGMMFPGQTYRRSFRTPGVYLYTDGGGHSGQIVVIGYTYLPLIMR